MSAGSQATNKKNAADLASNQTGGASGETIESAALRRRLRLAAEGVGSLRARRGAKGEAVEMSPEEAANAYAASELAYLLQWSHGFTITE